MDLLAAYAARYAHARPRHPVLLEAAGDGRLATEALVDLALADLRRERAGEDLPPSLPLLILQQRTTPEVLARTHALLVDPRPEARQLGALVLREHPGLDAAPHGHSADSIARLAQLLRGEEDGEVAGWALSAVAWQCHPAGLPVLLPYAGDGRVALRTVVVDGLFCLASRGQALPPAARAVLLELAADGAAEVRWSVFWELGEEPSVVGDLGAAFLNAAESAGATDPDPEVRRVARRAGAQLASWMGGSPR